MGTNDRRARTRTPRWIVAALLSAFLGAISATAASAVTIALGSGTAARGAQVSLPITLTGGAAGVSVDVLFPASVLSLAPTACVASPGTPGTVAAAQVNAPNTPAGTGRLRVRWVHNAATTGQVVTCTFVVAGNAPTGTHAVTSTMGQTSDAQGHALATQVVGGTVTVTH